MMPTILCPVDFSDSSNDALKWSVSMAKSMNGHLTILHAYRLLQSKNGQAAEMKKKTEEDAVHKFSLLENEILKSSGVEYDFIMEVGFIADRVEDYAKKNTISLLVMDKGMSVGSKETFQQLMDNLHVPLVIVPQF